MRACLLVVACACGRIDFGTHSPDAPRADVAADPDTPGDVCMFDICEGFEAGFTPGLWTPSAGGVSLDTIAHSGLQSAHFVIPTISAGTEGDATIVETETFAAGSKPFWVRAWIRIVGAPINNNALELMSANQPGNGPLGDFLFEHSDSIDIYTQFTDAAMQIPTMPQQATWTCVTWSVVPATNASGTITLTGQLGSTQLTSTTDGNPALANIALGLHFSSTNVSSAQPQIEMWIDDVTIHHAAISCAP